MNLFEQLLERSGLASIIARSSMTRALAKANLKPQDLTSENLPQVLGEIRKTLLVYMPLEQALERIEAINELTRGRSVR